MSTLSKEQLLDFEITKEDLQIEDLLASPFMYEQQLIKFLLTPQICEISRNMNTTLLHYRRKVLKIEGLEKLTNKMYAVGQQIAEAMNHYGPVTCHLFDSPEGASSFPMHTDPDDVYLYIVSGTKNMIVNGVDYELQAGERLFIPRNTPHQAINKRASQMLSFGLERFLIYKL